MLKTMIHGRRALLLPVGRASSLLALPRIGANYSKLFSTSILSPTTQFPYAYECSLFGDIETDKLYVEKSIKNGCTTVLTKSNDQSHEIYELMFDISDDMDGVDIKNFYFCHILTVSKSNIVKNGTKEEVDWVTQTKNWTTELDGIHKTLSRRAKHIDAVTVQLLSTDQLKNEGFKGAMADLSGYCATRDISLGLDFDTKLLASANADSLDQALAQNYDSLIRSSSSKLLLPPSSFTIACNCFTFPAVAGVLSFAKEKQVYTLATEILKSDRNKPGLLLESYDMYAPHLLASANESGSSSNASSNSNNGKPSVVHLHISSNDKNAASSTTATTSVALEAPESMVTLSTALQTRLDAIHEATTDFKMALDRCLKAEKVFIDKIVSSPKNSKNAAQAHPLMRSMLLAHMLVTAQSSVTYPEEWEFIVRRQIVPGFDGSSLQLKKLIGQDATDWLLLYQPMFKYLLASFRHLLQCRTRYLTQEVSDMLNDSLGCTTGVSTVSSTSTGTDDPMKEESMAAAPVALRLAALLAQASFTGVSSSSSSSNNSSGGSSSSASDANSNAFDCVALGRSRVDVAALDALRNHYYKLHSTTVNNELLGGIMGNILKLCDDHNDTGEA